VNPDQLCSHERERRHESSEQLLLVARRPPVFMGLAHLRTQKLAWHPVAYGIARGRLPTRASCSVTATRWQLECCATDSYRGCNNSVRPLLRHGNPLGRVVDDAGAVWSLDLINNVRPRAIGLVRFSSSHTLRYGGSAGAIPTRCPSCAWASE
jgi:hypothetical protein